MLPAAVRWDEHEVGLTLQNLELRELDHRVMSEGPTCLALAASAVTAMNEHWQIQHAIPDRTAGAPAVKRRWFNLGWTLREHVFRRHYG
jgi:hypothetical protein